MGSLTIEQLEKSKANLFELWKEQTKKNTKRARLFAASFDEVQKLINEKRGVKNVE